MKRAKLVFVKHSGMPLGNDAKLVDIDTGEELVCCRDITISFPLNGPVMAQADIQISQIEVVEPQPFGLPQKPPAPDICVVTEGDTFVKRRA